MKKLLLLLVLTLIGCTNENMQCNCQVEGNDSFVEVISEGGIDIIHSSLPVFITPYDTIVDCDQDGVSWYKVTETIAPPRTITKTSFRKINCN